MNLEEGLHKSWKYEGLQEALESGEVISKEDHKMELIKHLARTAKSMMNSGLSLDQCLEFIEEDLRDSVRKELQKENLQP